MFECCVCQPISLLASAGWAAAARVATARATAGMVEETAAAGWAAAAVEVMVVAAVTVAAVVTMLVTVV